MGVAQPRPVLTVPPKGIGPTDEPNRNDVLCGRGGLISSHDGNVQFRKIVNSRKKEYLAPTTKKLEGFHSSRYCQRDSDNGRQVLETREWNWDVVRYWGCKSHQEGRSGTP